MTNRRTRGLVEATEGQRISFQSCKNTGILKEPIHGRNKYSHLGNRKRRNINCRICKSTLVVRTHFNRIR
jgi:hypothetical protein